MFRLAECKMGAFSVYSADKITVNSGCASMLWFREGRSLSKLFTAQMQLSVLVLLHRLFKSYVEEIKNTF